MVKQYKFQIYNCNVIDDWVLKKSPLKNKLLTTVMIKLFVGYADINPLPQVKVMIKIKFA